MLKNTGGLSVDAFAKVLRQSLEQSYLQQFPDFDKRFRHTYYRWLKMHQEGRKRQDKIKVSVQPTGKINSFQRARKLVSIVFWLHWCETREDRPTISIDGNFQQVHGNDSRLLPNLNQSIFFMDMTKTEARNVKANSCASNFQAPKQKPGDALIDSQALLGVPFGDVLEIVKQVVQRYPTAPKWGVTYDVGCALESSLTILGKELDKDFLVAVNKFHVYAHQISCIERYWSKAAFLVRQLKTSSAIHRHQSLDAHIEYTSSNMTSELGAALCDRLWRATKTLAATWDLEKLNVNKDDILVQIDSQKTYVTSRWIGVRMAETEQLFRGLAILTPDSCEDGGRAQNLDV
ncbi:hypothetical protein POJ06DRAFT_277413 [Lipomyces tetrasporus]|uniref:Uncharacterized protein n=1 Tax=Lipomyces tetrasporus TaxID=54092 RepID=A0AAD7QMN1_9ASCO|nr:uncharacterized protein POJ06DRAFT_277413 [Lipomyces tetrasporus]KAJ8098150.1 hypothetical protein POJ06DRAFT_277413 [Lipomyces tetrasporus]